MEHEALALSTNAITTLRTGLETHPDHPALKLALGTRLEELGRYDEAVRTFQKLLTEDPAHAGGWRGLAMALQNGGLTASATLALAPLVVLGEATDEEREQAERRRLHPGWGHEDSFDAKALQAINPADDWAHRRVTELLRIIMEALGKLYPLDLRTYGLTGRDRLVAHSQHPLVPLCERLSKAFGAYEYELYVHHQQAVSQDVLVELTDPPTLLVPNHLGTLSEPQQIFLIARAYAAMTMGSHPARRIPGDALGLLVAAAVRTVLPGYAAGRYGATELAKAQKRLLRALSRRQRRVMEGAAVQFADEPPDFDAWYATVEPTVTCAAAVIANDLPGTVDALRVLGGIPATTNGTGLVRSSARIADLLRSWVTAPSLNLRREAGII